MMPKGVEHGRSSKLFARRFRVKIPMMPKGVVNDDGSAPGMYDLRVGPANAPQVAIECVGAVDQTFTET